jgi:hypothetical protein
VEHGIEADYFMDLVGRQLENVGDFPQHLGRQMTYLFLDQMKRGDERRSALRVSGYQSLDPLFGSVR